MELSASDASAKRRLRLELAGAAGVSEVAREIAKRLSTIAKARSFLDWDKVKGLVADLSTQHRAIVEQVGGRDSAEALSLLWRFLALVSPVLGRCDDSSGRIGELFRSAARDLGPLSEQAGVDPLKLADRVFEALRDNDYGQYDELIEILAPQLGPAGLERLKTLFTARAAEERSNLPDSERRVVGWGSSTGRIFADEIEEQSRSSAVRLSRQHRRYDRAHRSRCACSSEPAGHFGGEQRSGGRRARCPYSEELRSAYPVPAAT